MYVNYIKRPVDILLSISALLLLLPFGAVIALWIKLDSKGPVLFRQTRIGRGKTRFSILKFRTMRTDTPSDMPTHLLRKPDHYITRSGRFLRRTSLDELPQCWNVLIGEMSLVGPRPALWNQDDLIAEREKYGANDLPPGLTGWAQVNGRDELDIKEKARLDGEYARRVSFGFDFLCLAKTVLSVLWGDGILEGGKRSPGQTRKNPR